MFPKRLHIHAAAILAAALCTEFATAQTNRISQPIDNRARTVLAGHLHPKALPANDQGRVAPSLAMSGIVLTLAPTASQQTDLQKLLADQQTPGSPNYHRWLTPSEYAQRFGVSQADLDKITQWLQTQGLTIDSVGLGHTSVAVSGNAAQVESAFQAEIHTYAADGEIHYANASEPSVPAAFGSVVKGIRGLNDFRLKPHHVRMRKPDYTMGRGGEHFLAPNDLATIYDITALYTQGIDGTGQKIAVAGQVQINLADIDQFRSSFGLAANDPQTVLVPGRSAGNDSGDLGESDLDLEWAGAVARNATIIFVTAYDVMTAVQYAIDHDIAPVVSLTYGECELEALPSDSAMFQQWAQQANAQGITWFSASGDAGAADCDDTQNPGLAVDLPGAVPEVTSVGGTEFAENGGIYWNATNNSTGASAISYIPETAWNDSATDKMPSSGGGGTSVLFSKPSWQTGPGVPGDNARHVPDVAVNASADHDGYMTYTGGSTQVAGGTSAGAPVFAGLTALLNQQLGTGGVGNINPNLYALAQSAPGIFHDVTTGNNIVTVPCTRRAATCNSPAVGYNAGVGYDQATGLGSVDAFKFVTQWNGGSAPQTSLFPRITLLSNVSSVVANDVVYVIATVTSTDGTEPVGTVAFAVGQTQLGTAPLTGSAGTATATLVVNAAQLPVGAGTITADYNSQVTASVTVNVGESGSGGATPAIKGLANGASFKQSFAPGEVLTVFGSQLSLSTQSAAATPLPLSAGGVSALVNGVVAPLYYVSPGQLNIQIPYETTVNSTATLSINDNGQVSTQSFSVAAVAPGIFTDSTGALVPTPGAVRGQEIAFYITGAGMVSPAIPTGAAPLASTALANLPAPVNTTTVTIGGATATIDFIGIPPGLVGVTQINVQVPSGISTGAQPVVVTINGVAGAPATLEITG
jgi:uncharacterized protein (TIGR03437 family)